MALSPPPSFDPAWYLAAYPDVAAAGRDPWRHYRRHGRREGRLPAFLPALWRARDLRWGLLEEGEADLRAMAAEPPGPNRSQAAIALAGAAARRGDWAAAAGWLAPLDPRRELIGLAAAPDPLLLAIEAAVVTGAPGRARALLAEARRAFGARPDVLLAEANLRAAETGFGAGWQRLMARLYAPALLPGLRLAPGTGPGFDRLAVRRRLRPRGAAGPLVSVIMPARDAGATIATALASLSAQSWQALEILVVDNGSRDDTPAVVRAQAQRDPRIRLLDGGAEPGAYAARNLGAAAARGAFLTVLDADDWAHPARIATQLRALAGRPRAMAVLSDWVRATPALRFTRWAGEAGLIHPDMSSLMIRAEARARLGFWDRARAGADSEYHERLLAVFGPEAVTRALPGRPLGIGRVHPGSLTQAPETSAEGERFGARRHYMLAARRWHAAELAAAPDPTPGPATGPSTGVRPDASPPPPDAPGPSTGPTPGAPPLPLQLPQYPARRPFPLPAALTPEPADPPPAPESLPALVAGGLYDDAWMMRSYPDLRARDEDGLAHYQSSGAAMGRDPGPDFSTSGHALARGLRPEASAAHYLAHGRAAGDAPLPVFAGALPAPEPGRHLLVAGHQAGREIFGAERCLLSSLDRAREAGMTPSVVLPQLLNAAYRDAILARCHRLHLLPFGWRYGGVAPDPRSLARLTALIRDSGAVALHQNSCVLDAPLRAARAAGVATVLHLHELPASDPRLCADLGLSAEALRRTLLAEADRFVVPSEAVRDWLAAPPGRVTLLPNRIEAGLAALPFAPARPPRVALIGSLSARKGLLDARAVARGLARAGLAAEVRLIGPASPDLARLGRLPANMRHMGYAASPAAALAQADIVLSLSHVAESFGLTVLEALSAGRPVVCYDRGTPPALLGADGTGGAVEGGAVVAPGDPGAVVAALAPWLRDPARLAAASARARARGAALLAELAAAESLGCFAPE